jgi:hypothetical protein
VAKKTFYTLNFEEPHYPDKIRSFDVFRNSITTPEIVTFDELLARAEWMTERGTEKADGGGENAQEQPSVAAAVADPWPSSSSATSWPGSWATSPDEVPFPDDLPF